MVAKKPAKGKKYFTVAEANATLPLVRAIVRDISELAQTLEDRQERVERCRPQNQAALDPHAEEVQELVAEIERGHERMGEYVEELARLGIELKDFRAGLIDFPCWVGNREVCLCWRLGESEVSFWHEVNAGFAGRQEIVSLGGVRSRGAEAGAAEL